MNIKKRDVIIYVVVLISLLTIFSVFLVATDVISFDNNDNQQTEDGNSNYILPDNTDWINYILSMNITDIKITRIRSTELGDEENLNKTVTIDVDDLTKILTALEHNEIVKHYTLGFGGPDKDHLTVKYELEGQSYKFEIYYNSIVPKNIDDGLLAILENNNYKEVNVENKDIDGSFYFYNLIGFSGTIYDEYFD